MCSFQDADMRFSLVSLVKFHRRQAGLSQHELADLADVSRKVVQAVEAGEEGIQWRNVCAILDVLNIRLEPTGPLVAAWKENDEENEST